MISYFKKIKTHVELGANDKLNSDLIDNNAGLESHLNLIIETSEEISDEYLDGELPEPIDNEL